MWNLIWGLKKDTQYNSYYLKLPFIIASWGTEKNIGGRISRTVNAFGFRYEVSYDYRLIGFLKWFHVFKFST